MSNRWNFKNQESPLELRFSLLKLLDFYKSKISEVDGYEKTSLEKIIKLIENNPDLIEGLDSSENLSSYKKEVDYCLSSLFPSPLQANEIKKVTMPFQAAPIKSSSRYQDIITKAGNNFEPSITNFDENHYYIMGCSIILMNYYNFNIDFRRPFFYEIPNSSEMMRYYRILYNGDYISIEKKNETPQISQEDIDVLLNSFDDIELWKKKFPPQGYIFRGFVIANLYDATLDVSISNLKSGLLRFDQENENFTDNFHKIFQAIFNLPELHTGFSNFNTQEKTLELVPFKNINSYLLYGQKTENCHEVLCDESYKSIFDSGKYFAIADVQKKHEDEPAVRMYQNLFEQGIRSAILAPIKSKGKLLGILELASPEKYALNSINANKLADVMPYIIDSVLRSKEQQENEIDLIIQDECTSIHKSVYWKFEQEARRFLRLQLEGDTNVQFRDVVFRDVYPLFAQVDIKGSSDARNKATQQDILLQLTKAIEILEEAHKQESLPIYEQLIFSLNEYHADTEESLEVDSERKILDFLSTNIRPLFSHLLNKSEKLQEYITSYRSQLEDNLGLVYKHRKVYDENVMLLNRRMASVLERNQKEAQKMYPHFFELFKTDGVEHNMYIGEAITKKNDFNKIYLYNLRLWQLQVVCEMENVHFSLSRKQEKPLEVASMILAFNTSLSVRYRLDEKRFDVDGTYNARYEVVKKRVDKAFIKDTEERVTQAGKLTIVYSQKEDEKEYLKYISFLQSKKQLGDQVEILELEDLQAVTGLKAIRVNILYSQGKSNERKSYYTYDDLIDEISS